MSSAFIVKINRNFDLKFLFGQLNRAPQQRRMVFPRNVLYILPVRPYCEEHRPALGQPDQRLPLHPHVDLVRQAVPRHGAVDGARTIRQVQGGPLAEGHVVPHPLRTGLQPRKELVHCAPSTYDNHNARRVQIQ